MPDIGPLEYRTPPAPNSRRSLARPVTSLSLFTVGIVGTFLFREHVTSPDALVFFVLAAYIIAVGWLASLYAVIRACVLPAPQ
jgi:hypothetical protein